MYTKDYVQAAYEVLREKDDSQGTLRALKTYLKNRGLLSMYPQILRGLIDKIERKNKSLIPTVTVAREKDLKRFKKEIETATKEFGNNDEYKTVIDTAIIGGYVVKGSNRHIDQSYKSKLLQAYRSLID